MTVIYVRNIMYLLKRFVKYNFYFTLREVMFSKLSVSATAPFYNIKTFQYIL